NEVAALCAQGIDRVMAAKELTLDEITTMAYAIPQKIDLFGFGHLPMSFSRRPLVRNYLEEIGLDSKFAEGMGLRIKEVKRNVYFPILEDDKATVIFADTVFCVLNELKALACNGVHAIIVDDLFVDPKLLPAYIRSCKNILNGDNPRNELENLREIAPELDFASGYFYQKTNLTKEGASL
ncbi:MAG: hypothetical protein E4G74_03525, partial [Erysipelotrichales bacterium]